MGCPVAGEEEEESALSTVPDSGADVPGARRLRFEGQRMAWLVSLNGGHHGGH